MFVECEMGILYSCKLLFALAQLERPDMGVFMLKWHYVGILLDEVLPFPGQICLIVMLVLFCVIWLERKNFL